MQDHVGRGFGKRARLDTRGVERLLKDGRRTTQGAWETRSLPQSSPCSQLAISVPKKRVKSAVQRNRIKRLVRETFRQHGISLASHAMLVTYRGSGLRATIPMDRGSLLRLFDGLLRRCAPH